MSKSYGTIRAFAKDHKVTELITRRSIGAFIDTIKFILECRV